MIARTGWNIGMSSNDVVAEIKGGGYHFGNRQHSDAGSIQLYYRGLQFGDLGVYKFYGTPYDMGFNKRSIAHSMMLAVDPSENIPRNAANASPARASARDRFLTVMQVTADETRPLPVTWYETPVSYVVVNIADRIVSMSNSEALITGRFRLKVAGPGKKQVVLTALKAGKWSVSGGSPRIDIQGTVEEGINTLYFEAGKGDYVIAPVG